MIEIREARSKEDLERVHDLFAEYASMIGHDIEFQGFHHELASLPGAYAAPGGLLLLAWDGPEAVGCGAIRPLEPGGCEMKRLYVRPSCRGTGAGRRLAEALIEGARLRGYPWMRLDTLLEMEPALRLYRALGFREIGPYRTNPLPGVVYMELDLTAASP